MFREFGGTAKPLRGEKSTAWEGGSRVPCTIHWPGKITPRESDSFMVGYDWLKTLTAMTGIEVPKEMKHDSQDLSEMILGSDSSPRNSHIFLYSVTPCRYSPRRL